MGLQEQHVAFKFAGGIETKMDSKAVPAVRLLGLENGVFHRASSIKKRNGYSLLSRTIDGSASLVEDARRLAARDDELLLFTLTRCYSQQSEIDQWSDAGALIAPLGSERPVVRTGSAQTMPDHAINAGVVAYAWEDSRGGVWWTVEDATSGRIYRAPAQAHADGQRPRCVPVGDVIHIYYAVPALRQIQALIVNPATPGAAASTAIVVEDLDTTNPVYDVCATTKTGTPAVIAWHEHATTNVRIGYVLQGGALGSPANGYTSVSQWALALHATSPLAIAFDDIGFQIVAVAYVRNDNTGRVFFTNAEIDLPGGSSLMYSGTTDVQRVALTVRRPDGGSSAIHTYAAYEEAAAEPSERFCVVATRIGAAPLVTQILRSVGLASRAFLVDGGPFAVLVHDSTYFNTYFTFRLSDFAPVGRHLVASASGAPTRSHLSSVHVTDSVARVTLPDKTRLKSENNDKFSETGLSLVTMDFDSEDTHQTAQLGRGLYLAAACPQHYDSRLWTEQGFHVGPELIVATPGSGGSLTPSSTYEYVVWYEWTDFQGEIHRGPTSVPVSVELGVGDDRVELTLPTLRITRKSNVRICVARSLPGDTSRLFRVSSLDPTTEGDVNGYIANDTTVDSVSFTDDMSDDDAREEEELYTTSGILSNDPVPLGSHVAAGKNRLFFTDAQSGSVVRFSKRIATGFGAEFAPELQHDIDPIGGDITALRVMDDVVFVFKAGAILAFNGDGPFEDGQNASGGLVMGFSSSQLITSDVGCTDPSSIVLTPQGLMFKSAKGIRLLTRSREIAPVGDPVEAYNSQNVRRATVMPDRTAVLFLTDEGSSLYYDYQFGQWSTFTNHEGLDACVVGNTYHYLRANDVVFREAIGEHRDGNARITLRLETAWLHLHEHLQGFQRFWKLLLLGTWVSSHQLAVSHRTNYDEAWSEPHYLDATGDTVSAGWITGDSANPIGEDPITGTAYGEGDYGEGDYGGVAPDVYQWRYGIHEDGQAVQFRFEDFEKAGLAGASFELTEMTIVGGIKKPDMRPFSAARST